MPAQAGIDVARDVATARAINEFRARCWRIVLVSPPVATKSHVYSVNTQPGPPTHTARPCGRIKVGPRTGMFGRQMSPRGTWGTPERTPRAAPGINSDGGLSAQTTWRCEQHRSWTMVRRPERKSGARQVLVTEWSRLISLWALQTRHSTSPRRIDGPSAPQSPVSMARSDGFCVGHVGGVGHLWTRGCLRSHKVVAEASNSCMFSLGRSDFRTTGASRLRGAKCTRATTSSAFQGGQ